MANYEQYLVPSDAQKSHLIVFIHGWAAKPETIKAFLGDVIDHDKTEIFAPKLPHSSKLSTTPIEAIARDLRQVIADYDAKRQFKKITLMGHSMGSQIVREMYCQSWEETPTSTDTDPDFQMKENMEWVTKIDRVLYIAGIHRGWTIDSFVSRATKFGARIGDLLTLRKTTVGGVHRGAKGLIALRLRAIKLNRFLAGTDIVTPPLTLQILGTTDDLVDPTSQLPNVLDEDHFFIEIYGSGHAEVIRTPSTLTGDAATGVIAQRRAERIKTAIYATKPKLRREFPSDFLQSNTDVAVATEPDDSVTDVVFIIHGIRDRGYWTSKIARMISQMQKAVRPFGSRKFVAVYPTYGYFPIMDFTFPILRRGKVAWLADQYVNHRARYPKAVFHYVGHSNGTQLFTEAVMTYQDLKFERVVFAGSVVKKNFNWAPYLGGQIKKLRNYVATKDIVVAVLPKGLQALGLFNLGSAGHDGFTHFKTADLDTAATHEGENVRFIDGGHGAAIKDQMWKEIATFITLNEEKPKLLEESLRPKQSGLTRFAGGLSGLLVTLIMLVVLGVLFLILTWLAETITPGDYDTILGVWQTHGLGALDPGKLARSAAAPMLVLAIYWGVLKFAMKKF